MHIGPIAKFLNKSRSYVTKLCTMIKLESKTNLLTEEKKKNKKSALNQYKSKDPKSFSEE